MRGGEGEGRRGVSDKGRVMRGGEGGVMRGEGQSKNEGTTKSRWNSVEVKIPLQQHKAICYSFNSRGSVIVELLCKASGTLQTVSGAGTCTPLTDGWTRQTEASAWLKVFCTQRECGHHQCLVHPFPLSLLPLRSSLSSLSSLSLLPSLPSLPSFPSPSFTFLSSLNQTRP